MFRNILLLCGPTGSGKTYIANKLYKECNKSELKYSFCFFNLPKQVTTRQRRPEEDIYSYYFINNDEYDIIQDKLTCKTVFNGNNYGTLKDDILLGDVINIIVASKSGLENTILDYTNDKDMYNTTIIKTALVLNSPNIDTELLNDRNRSLSFVNNERNELLTRKYDLYIPNYGEIDFEHVAKQIRSMYF